MMKLGGSPALIVGQNRGDNRASELMNSEAGKRARHRRESADTTSLDPKVIKAKQNKKKLALSWVSEGRRTSLNWNMKYNDNAKAQEEQMTIWVKASLNPQLENFVSFLIVVNSIMIGIETDHGAANPELMRVLTVVEYFFILCYIIEIFVKTKAFGVVGFFRTREDSGWNTFDFLVVAMSLINIAILLSSGEGSRFLVYGRVFRMIRLFRLFRAVKALRVFIEGIVSSLENLFWAVVIVVVCLYIFSVIATQEVGANAALYGEEMATIELWFGTIDRSMFTLFQIMTLEWAPVARLVQQEKPTMWVFFVAFLCCTTFAFFNMVTGILVDNTMKATAESRVRRREANLILPELQRIFDDLDADGNGELTRNEMEVALKTNSQLEHALEGMGLTYVELLEMYDVVDVNNDGKIQWEEFLQEFVRLGDGLTVKDLHLLRARMYHRMERLEKKCGASPHPSVAHTRSGGGDDHHHGHEHHPTGVPDGDEGDSACPSLSHRVGLLDQRTLRIEASLARIEQMLQTGSPRPTGLPASIDRVAAARVPSSRPMARGPLTAPARPSARSSPAPRTASYRMHAPVLAPVNLRMVTPDFRRPEIILP